MFFINKISGLWFILYNVFASMFLPRINIGEKNGLLLLPVERDDVFAINNIYKLSLGEGKDLSLSKKLLFMLCGRKLAVKVVYDGKIIAYKLMYFHFDELVQKKYLHSASSAMLAEYRGGGRGKTMYYATWDWYQYHTWVKGVSSRYEVSNSAVKYLHENYGSFPTEHYIQDGEEWVYSVKVF